MQRTGSPSQHGRKKKRNEEQEKDKRRVGPVAKKAKKNSRTPNRNYERNRPVAQNAQAEGKRKEMKSGPVAQTAEKQKRRDKRQVGPVAQKGQDKKERPHAGKSTGK